MSEIAVWDKHENFNFIQTLKNENSLTRKVIFYFYFLEMTVPEIAEEMEKSEKWVNRKIRQWKDTYY